VAGSVSSWLLPDWLALYLGTMDPDLWAVFTLFGYDQCTERVHRKSVTRRKTRVSGSGNFAEFLQRALRFYLHYQGSSNSNGGCLSIRGVVIVVIVVTAIVTAMLG
jgi:hypothetical protein